MRKNLTEVVFILDRSGSMAGLERETIGGFNSLIEKQKQEAGEALISTVLFDNVSEVIHDRMPVDSIEALTEKDYYVRGCTALLDAVGGAVTHIRRVHTYIREEDRPEKTLFIITTDGLENSSHHYSVSKVRELIQQQKECGWEFLFLGANIDAVQEAGRFGIDEDHAADYRCDAAGTALNYEVLSAAVSEVRACSSGADGKLGRSWKTRIEADYENRK